MTKKHRILKSTENQLQRKSNKFKNWRKAVFECDSYTCQECGSKKELHPHHIRPFAKYPELRFITSNGKTLCSVCHGKKHGMTFSKLGTYLTCIICKIRFRPKGGHLKQRTCSRKCGYILRRQKPNKKKGKHYTHLQRARIGHCLECNAEFRAIKDFKNRKQKFCSHVCYLKYRWNFTGKKAELLK